MKTSPAIFLSLFLVLGASLSPAQEAAPRPAREMAVNAEVQERFYDKYPDLTDERDIVTKAAQQLAKQGDSTTDTVAAAEVLAARARAILARRTPPEWQRKAVSLYPALGVAGSEFNRLFLQRYRELERTSPQFQQEPSWPVLLAKRCADELRTRPTTSVAGVPVIADPSTVGEVTNRTPTQNFWLSALSVTLLIALLWLPARWLFRVSRAFGTREETVTLWQQALGLAAWVFCAVALSALFRTFRANADLGFIDRFGITLLVSFLAAVAATLPSFLIAWGLIAWQRRLTGRAESISRLPASAGTMRSEPSAK